MRLSTILPTALGALTLQNPVLVAPDAGGQDGRSPIVVAPPATRMILLDIGDLVEVAPAEASNDPTVAKEPPEMRRMRATGDFAEILERWMKPAFDVAIDHLELVAPGRISLVASEAQLDWAQRFCDLQRSEKDFVFVQVHILEGGSGTLRTLGLEGGTKILENQAELDRFLATAKNLAAADLIVAPRLLTRPRQRATLSTGETIAYVQDWKIETVEPGPREIAVPTIGSLFHGHEIDARAFAIEKGVFGLDLRFTNTKVERPLPVKRIRIGSGAGQEVEIATPTSQKIELKTRASLADGATSVFGMVSSDEHREVVVAVTLQRGIPDSQPR